MRRLRELLKAADDGAHVAPDKITVGDWVPKWLDLKARSIEAQTHDRYEDLMNCHVVPCLGKICLQRLTISDINEFYGKLALAPSTAALLHNV